MIVLLPTFNRTQVLPWVIESILQSDVSGINERILILLVNNFYPGKQAIDEIINPIKFMPPFECVVIHRKQKLVAVESWFKAIFEYAHEDEIIVMLGDDDLLLPKTLKRCFETIDACQADMLVTDYFQRLYFSADGSNFVFIGDDLHGCLMREPASCDLSPIVSICNMLLRILANTGLRETVKVFKPKNGIIAG